jgi:adenine-specific DNA-methyltransferase
LTAELQDDGWTLSDANVQRLLAKLRKTGRPLGEYVNGKIYRGVLTGLNEAFVIDEAAKTQLIAEDPACVEIIKPFLAGRDIKRYRQPKSDKYLIFTRRGIKIEKYPAILNYLLQFKERLEPKPKNFTGRNWKGRKPGSYKWYEIQDAVDYYGEFEKPKVIIPAITKSANYAYDKNSYYSNDKTSIIPTNNLFLIGLLNSQLIDFYLKNIASTKQNGYFEYKPVYVSQLPVCEPEKQIQKNIESMVSQILALKKQNPEADTTAPEAEIDRIVYELYGLTEEEVKVVEGT